MVVKQFKQWLVENDLDNNELFNESIKCYQVEAYKAAYLFSYLGFIDYIKETILRYPRIPEMFKKKVGEKTPEEFDKLWKEKLGGLDSQDKWEENTLNFIMEVSEKNIFKLRNDIREEFLVRKNFRNVSAHNKKRNITEATIEDFWDFIVYSKPYFIVDGTVEQWLEMFKRTAKFTEKNNHEREMSILFKEYVRFQEEDKKKIFLGMLNEIKEAIHNYDYDLLTCADLFMNEILQRFNSVEKKWIKDEEVSLYLALSIDGYMNSINKAVLQEYSYSNEQIVLNQIIPLASQQKINEFLEYIYTNKKWDQWWEILVTVLNSLGGFCVEEKILKIIVESGKIERIFNELEEKLFNYKTSYDNKKYNTETFDYCMFRYYQGKIRLLLILIKNEMIEDEKTENLVKRCKKILEMDFTDEETSAL